MGARLYVGNLSYDTKEQGLRQLVEGDGRTVADVHIVTDRETGRSRGFAFVELGEAGDLTATIQQLDGSMLDGRRVSVSEARPRRPREGGSDRGGGGGRSGPGGGGPRFDRRPEPERQHRRPRFDGPRFEGPPGERRGPSNSGPPPGGGFGPPPDLAAAGRDEGRRRNKKWKDKSASGTEGEAPNRGGTPNRDGGGKRKKNRRWDDDDEW